MNVYPLHESSVTRKLKELHNQFKTLCKQNESIQFKKTEGWWKNVRIFNEGMVNKAYDIRKLCVSEKAGREISSKNDKN